VAEIELAKVESALKQLEMAARAYESDVNAYTAQVNANVSLVKGQAEIYSATVQGYSARASVIKSVNDTAIALFEANVGLRAQNMNAALKQADIQLSGAIQQMTLKVESIKAQAQISAEIIAAALNSTNTGASISFQAGMSENFSGSKAQSESFQHQINSTVV